MNTKINVFVICLICNCPLFGQVLFQDNFEGGLSKWEHLKDGIATIVKTDDTVHGAVLQLTPNKSAETVLIKGSDHWEKVVITGEALFPTEKHDYLGLVYNYNEANRIDYGSIYIKGKGSYIRVNPHRDGNASRALYEEYKTPLTGDAEIKVNEWFNFKAEIIGSEIHFYVADMEQPKVVFSMFEFDKGKIGFKPRLVGGEVWLDNITVRTLNNFSYTHATDIVFHREQLLNDWQAIGPFKERITAVERSVANTPMVLGGQKFRWMDFTTDPRGCVLAGKLSRYATDEKFVYFSTDIVSEEDTETEIQFSSLNNLQVWVNGEFIGPVEKQRHAWYDFFKNPDHVGRSLSVKLKQGNNRMVVLVEGGNYSGDGFYAHLRK